MPNPQSQLALCIEFCVLGLLFTGLQDGLFCPHVFELVLLVLHGAMFDHLKVETIHAIELVVGHHFVIDHLVFEA